MPANNGVQIDFISKQGSALQGMGPVAQRLLSSGFDPQALRTLDVLQKEEWMQIDQTVIEVARKNLVITERLMSSGLRYPVANALGTTQIQWERQSDMGPAEVSMSGVSEGERDRMTFDLATMPLPIIHKDFSLNIRALNASRNRGQALDTAQIALATRIVSELIEYIIVNGHGMTFGGQAIEGLANATNRNTGQVVKNWVMGASGASGEEIVDDVLRMITQLRDDNMNGPYGMIVGDANYLHLMEDYKAESDKTILSRMLEIPQLSFVVPSKDIPTNYVIMFQLTRDVIEVVDGIQPMVVEWNTLGGMVTHYKVMAIMVPRVRSTKTGQSGICVYTNQ